MRKKFKTTIVFGEAAVSRYADGTKTKRTLKKYGDVRTFSFATEAERAAFIQGIEETRGWHDACTFEEA